MHWMWVLMVGALCVAGCASRAPLPTVERKVDLERFMGDWYVIAGKFTWFERDAYNSLEQYELKEDGRIATTFTFRRGGFDGPEKRMTPVGFVHDHDTNAEWRMQFIWPFRAAYLIIYLDDDYRYTAIGVPSRRFLWIMAREPSIPDDAMASIKERLREVGYAVDDLTVVPQRWPE